MNRGKLQVFFSPNSPSTVVIGICREIGFTCVDDLGNYLSMPLLDSCVTYNTFDFVLNRV